MFQKIYNILMNKKNSNLENHINIFDLKKGAEIMKNIIEKNLNN